MTDTCLSEQFSLRWNDFSNNFSCGFISHLSEHDLVDVTLAVEGRLLQAHKLVLSICSPYFKHIFKANPCQHPVIILKDIKYEEVESLLKFMYQGEISIKRDDLPTFLRVAQTLQIKGLTSVLTCPETEEVKTLPNHECNSEDRSKAVILNEHGQEIDESKKLEAKHESSKTNLKRKQDDALSSEKGEYLDENKEPVVQDLIKEEIFLLSDEGSNDSFNIQLNKSLSNPKPTNINQASMRFAAVQPEPVTYRLSARGRPQLVHEGYVYNLTSRAEGLNRLHYRCAEQHRGCKGKCAVIAEKFMPTGVHDHNHPPGYQSEDSYKKRKGVDTESS